MSWRPIKFNYISIRLPNSELCVCRTKLGNTRASWEDQDKWVTYEFSLRKITLSWYRKERKLFKCWFLRLRKLISSQCLFCWCKQLYLQLYNSKQDVCYFPLVCSYSLGQISNVILLKRENAIKMCQLITRVQEYCIYRYTQ